MWITQLFVHNSVLLLRTQITSDVIRKSLHEGGQMARLYQQESDKTVISSGTTHSNEYATAVSGMRNSIIPVRRAAVCAGSQTVPLASRQAPPPPLAQQTMPLRERSESATIPNTTLLSQNNVPKQQADGKPNESTSELCGLQRKETLQNAVTSKHDDYQLAQALLGKVVLVEGTSGGVGTSTLCAMLAKHCAQFISCALVDADMYLGGLDVLLGLEHEEGARFSALQTAMGSINPRCLNQELIVWQSVRVLSNDIRPWHSTHVWQARHIIEACASGFDLSIIDAGRGEVSGHIESLTTAVRVLTFPLTVSGLERARERVQSIQSQRDSFGWNYQYPGSVAEKDAFDISDSLDTSEGFVQSDSFADMSAPSFIFALAMAPSFDVPKSARISKEQAQDFLGIPVIGTIAKVPRIAQDMAQGLPIDHIGRHNKTAIATLYAMIRQTLEYQSCLMLRKAPNQTSSNRTGW